MECPDCKGKGTTERPQSDDAKLKVINLFPMLCDRCSGSGDVRAAKPQTEGQAPTPVP
jgi:DnaJ-class molecular chaperone